MKRLVKYLLVCSVFFTFAVGCADLFREEIYDIHEELDKINARLDELCEEMNTNIDALQTIIEALQQKDYVEKIVPIKEGGVEVGYTIYFTQSGPVSIFHGEKGDDGHSPIVGMKQAEDGRWYWTIDDEWMRDNEGNLVLAFGKDGITPKFEVRDGDWYISYDDGETWTYYAQATGDKGDKGDSMFDSITYNEHYVTLVLADGETTIKIPTWASHMLLVDEIARINNNIVALQQAVEALEKNDYVTKVTPIEEDGEVLGYILSFAYTGDVSIYHGKDGHNPQVGVKQHTDGNWYWTVDDQWVLDENGNMIRTTGDNGLTPEFKIEDDKWYIRYGADQEWAEYGQATGDKGDQGEQGEQGDAIFAKDGIDVSNPNYIELTLVNGTKIQIPTLAAFQALEVFVGQINENVTALQTIVAALQNNDYVTSVSDIIDPQTDEKIGFTIHFSKSGNVNVYHGEDGKDGVTPTVTISEDGYWVINGEKQSTKALGVNGVTPQFKIVDGMWHISYDNAQSWSEVGQATGDQGIQGPEGPVGPQGPTGNAGDAFFKSVTEEYAKDEDGNEITDILGKKIVAYIVITLADGDDDDTNNPVYRIPTDYVISDLQQQIDAITNDIKTIEIVVNAVQNAEYIKSVTPVYDGMVEVGYEIVFAKYTVEGGETTRKTTIYHGTAGTNGTVIGAAYDEASSTWYWTIDGQPLKDAEGQLVPLKGQNGVDGVTPQMNINSTTNYWEVSYDGGNTWVSTNVKATGDKGDNGEDGSNADAYIQNVVLEGNYYVFYVKDGSTFSVPTAQAFEALAVKVAALEESVNSLSSVLAVLKGMKFIKSTESFENETGSGYKLVLVTFDPQTMTATEETCYVYDGKNGTNGTNGNDGHTPVIGLRQDANGDFYWTIDGNDLLVNGNPVKANGEKGSDGQAGANGPVPTFRIDEAGHLWVKVGDADEQDLGKVVGAAGSAGEAGTNASIEVTEKENGEIVITFKNGDQSTGSISVPSWSVFVALQEQVSVLNTNVDALQKTVEALEKNVYVTKVEDHYVDGVKAGYKITFSDGKEAVILHGAKGDQGDAGQDAAVPTFEVNADGYWVINGVTTTYKAVGDKGEQGITPEFKIGSYTDADGKVYSSYWYVRYGQNAQWEPLGNAEGAQGSEGPTGPEGPQGPQGPQGAEGASGDAFIYGIYPVGQDGVTTEGVTFTNAYYVKIVLKDETPDTLEDNVTYIIPTKKVTDDLYDLVSTLNENVAALQTAVNALSSRQYIKSYTPVEGGYKLTMSDGDDEGTEDDIIYINHGTNGTNGTNGVTPTVTVKADEDGVLYWWVNEAWLLDAQGNKVPATGPKGEPGNTGTNGQNGVTPIFMIGNAEYEGSTFANCWLVSYDNGQTWTAVLGTDGKPFVAKGEAGSSGATGDSFFAGVAFETEKNANGIDVVTYLVLTLNDNTVHKIPTEYTIQLLADRITALETQMMALQTLVNAISTQEYVKNIVGKYEGLVLTGYNITFVKYSLDSDGQLVEEEVIREVSIKGEANIPVIGVEKDEQTNIWYWTINGERLQVQGPQGEAGANAPVPSIGSNGNWFIGDQDTGVSAKGPQGETGATGPQGDSFFKDVYYEDKDGAKVSSSKNAYYLVFEMANDEVIKVPTASAFQTLINEVTVLQGTVSGLQALIENQKTALESLQGSYNDFVTGLSEKRFAGIPTYNEATQTWVFPIVDGTGAQISGENNSFTIVQGNVVTVAAKDGSDRLYWVIDGEVTDYPVTGNDGTNGLTPHFRVNVEEGTLEYTFDDPNSATANWVSLGSVKGPQGPQGNPGQPGTAASTNVVFTNNPYPAEGGVVFIESTDTDAVQAALWVGIQYGDNTSDIIWMPTYKNFQTLQQAITTLNSNVEALQAAVSALENNDYVTKIEDVTENGVVVGYKLTFAKSGEKIIYHGQKGETGADAVAPQVRINDATKEWEISTDGGETWTSTGVVAAGTNGDPGKDAVTPKFKIENGKWFVSYDEEQSWEELGQATGDTGASGNDGDSFFESVKPVDANGNDVASTAAEYIKIDLTSGESYLIPTQKTILAINTTISNLQTSVNAQIEAISEVVNALPNNKYITEIVAVDASKNEIADGSTTPVAGYKIVFYGSDPIYIMHGVDGAEGPQGPQGPQGDQGVQGTTPEITIGDNGNWFINGEDTGKVAVPSNGVDGATGPQGPQGITPQLQVNEDYEWEVSYDNGSTWTGLGIYAVPQFKVEDGKWMVSYDGGSTWTEKGQATGEPGASGNDGDSFFESVKPVDANGEDVSTEDAEYIKIVLKSGETTVEYLIPTQKTILALEARLTSIEGTVEALVTLLNETNTYISGITPDADGTGFTATVVSYTLNLDAKGNLVKDQSGNYYTITKTEQVRYDDSAVSVVKKDDGKWYWVVDGNETVLMDSGFIPQVHVADGFVYISTDPKAVTTDLTSGWVKINPNDSNTDSFATFETVEDGYKITFANGTSIIVPSKDAFDSLVKQVNDISSNITTIDSLLSGKTFVTNVQPVYDASNTNIIGFEITYRSVTGSVAENTASFGPEQTTTYTSSNYVVPVQENGVWYWYVNGTKVCEINHTFVPKIDVYEGYIYVSVDPKATNVASDILDATTAAYWKKLEHKDDNTQIPDTDTYGSYTEVKDGDVVVGYAITFPGSTSAINVGKYFATPKVSIKDAAGAAITELNIGSDANGSVNFSVVGSFDAEDAPEIIVTCEGGWTSSMERNNEDNLVTGTITVTPTAVFNSGAVSGKLTVYVTYYGQTSVKQISLKANANVQFNATKSVGSKGSTVEIPFSSSMIAESAVPSLGFVYEYKDTEEDSNIIEAPNVVSNNSAMHGQWIKNNGTVNGKISLSIDANLTSKKRAGVVVAYTPDKKTELARFRIIQEAGDYGIINLADPSNDGNYDPANCYVIQKGGKYMIPTFKGNNATKEGMFSIEGATVKIYNQYDNGFTNLFANSVTRVTTLDDGTPVPDKMLVFDIQNAIGGSSILNNGNTIIQVEKDGSILWSWHLWFNSEYEILGNSYGSQGFQNYPVTGAEMMDRNLGASDTDEAGLYYMWGNKNPYFTGIEVGTSTQASKYYGGGSATETWGDSKTIMDPCPPGYKVPNTNVWVATTSGSYNNSGFIYSSNPEIVYPFSGHVVNNSIDDDSKTLPKEITDSSVVVKYTGLDLKDPVKLWELIKDNISQVLRGGLTVQARRFTNIRYEIDMQQDRGALWGSSYQDAFQYFKQNISFSIDIINQVEVLECDYDTGTTKYKIEGNIFSGYTATLVEEKWDDNWNHITRQDLGLLWTAEKAEITRQIKNELNGDSNMVYTNSIIDTYDTQGCGLPVRCQKITSNN